MSQQPPSREELARLEALAASLARDPSGYCAIPLSGTYAACRAANAFCHSRSPNDRVRCSVRLHRDPIALHFGSSGCATPQDPDPICEWSLRTEGGRIAVSPQFRYVIRAGIGGIDSRCANQGGRNGR
jgi:hypothetical protein